MLGWSNSLAYANSTCIALWFSISGVTRDAQHPDDSDGCAFSIICFILFQRNTRFWEFRSSFGEGGGGEGLETFAFNWYLCCLGWSLDKTSYPFILKYLRKNKSFCRLGVFVLFRRIKNNWITLFERWKARCISFLYIVSFSPLKRLSRE